MSIPATSCWKIDNDSAELEPSAAHNRVQQPDAQDAGEHEADLDLPVANLLQEVMHLVRDVVRDLRELPPLLARPRDHPLRREAPQHEPARVRLRHLEDVEVGIE